VSVNFVQVFSCASLLYATLFQHRDCPAHDTITRTVQRDWPASCARSCDELRQIFLCKFLVQVSYTSFCYMFFECMLPASISIVYGDNDVNTIVLQLYRYSVDFEQRVDRPLDNAEYQLP